MTDAMTTEQCRTMQSKCADALHKRIDELLAQGNANAVNIGRIMGYLGLNGNGNEVARQHHRDTEAESHEHRRAADALVAATEQAVAVLAAVQAQPKTRAEEESWLKRNWWALILAALAGERILTELPKALKVMFP